jgi:hypothetical protein
MAGGSTAGGITPSPSDHVQPGPSLPGPTQVAVALPCIWNAIEVNIKRREVGTFGNVFYAALYTRVKHGVSPHYSWGPAQSRYI